MNANPPASTDAELVKSALAGDSPAFANLVERYHGTVHAIALARLGDSDAADELTQEAFLRAYLNLKSLRDPARLQPGSHSAMAAQ